MNKNVIIYGVGRFAEYAAYLFQNDSAYNLKGFCIEREYLKNNNPPSPIKELDLFKFEELGRVQNDFDLFIAVGNNSTRQRIYKAAKENGFSFANYISSKAVTWENLIIGENVFIGEGSVIQPFVRISSNSFIIAGRIGHHSQIGKHVLISGSTIGGNTNVGDLSFLGLNSAISQNLTIGKANIIGMNTTIERSTRENAVYSHKGTTLRKMNSSKVSDRTLR